MNLTARDKKLAMILVPIALVGAYWMLLLSPQRQEAAAQTAKLAEAEAARDQAQAQAGSLQGARANYAKDYAVVVRLGKAIPSTVDMPSLIVQLNSAAKGTGISFTKVVAGSRTTAAGASPAAPSGDSAGGAPAADAGGEQAQTGVGKAAETANGASATSDQANAASGADAPAGATPSATAPAAPGLDSVPLQFTFTGEFFDLADFFHRMKRFVYVANGQVKVQGRLLTIDNFKFDSTNFPALKTDVSATVYLSPKEQGATAGASPAGPAPAAAPVAPQEAEPTTAASTDGGAQ